MNKFISLSVLTNVKKFLKILSNTHTDTGRKYPSLSSSRQDHTHPVSCACREAAAIQTASKGFFIQRPTIPFVPEQYPVTTSGVDATQFQPLFQIGMGKGRCGGDEDEDETDAYDPSDKGPNSKRGCTDVPCLLLLVAFIAAWVGVGFYSFAFGNPAQLIHPSNSEGEICGRGLHAKRPFLLFFDLSKCARLSSALSGCPTPQVV